MSSSVTTSRARRLVGMLSVLVALAAGLVVVVAPASAPSAEAANASDFQDGYIISDRNFFDSQSMTVAEVQSFLNSKLTTCRGANGMPCLKDYYARSTPAMAATAYCASVPGGTMSAAQLIVTVSRACGINPKVILVMLQKEQGLITATSPTARNYSAALGQGCPDGAPCDPNQAGFFHQIYGAARQFQIYMKFPRSFSYQLGWNNVLYQATPPDNSRVCGTKRVYIQNDATRALYIYTPYTPNQAAMGNLYGTGDFCSSYGNRNFWRLYTDWFGSPITDVRARIDTTYAGFGGSRGWLGAAAGDYLCGLVDGGCYRPYANGRIYASELTAGVSVAPAIQKAWDVGGAESGSAGYPQAEAFTAGPGWLQSFGGGIAVLPDGRDAQFVAGPLGDAWFNAGGLGSMVGAPTSQMYCTLVSDGCVQVFAGGWYYWSAASGAHYVNGPVLQAWSDRGSETGALGYPLGEPVRDAVSGGNWAHFQGGVLYVDKTGKSWLIGGDAAAAYVDAATNGNSLGAPVGERTCASGGCVQQFAAGAVVQADGGAAQFVAGSIGAAWLSAGGFASPAGAPKSGMNCGLSEGGCLQVFVNGWYYWSPKGGAHLVPNALLNAWSAAGSERGVFGYPLGVPVAVAGGTVQSFRGGVGVVSDGGAAQFVAGSIGAAWLSAGGFASPAGAPTSGAMCDPTGSPCSQTFAGGQYSWTPTTGVRFDSR